MCLSWLYAPHFSTVGLVDSSGDPFGPIHIHFESAQVGRRKGLSNTNTANFH